VYTLVNRLGTRQKASDVATRRHLL